jgi:DNA repair exonuclease SbcCD ATPase subunit
MLHREPPHVTVTSAIPIDSANGATIIGKTTEQRLAEKSMQLKKLAKAFNLLQQEKKALEEHCLLLEAENVELKVSQQNNQILNSKTQQLVKHHEKMLLSDEESVFKLQDKITQLEDQRDKFLYPQIKQFQQHNSKLSKFNIQYKKQLKELRDELKTKTRQIEILSNEIRDEKIAKNLKELEEANAQFFREGQELRKELSLYKGKAADTAEQTARLIKENEELTAELQKKTEWNIQTQLSFAEKKELVDILKRQKGSLIRQLKRETKKGIKRELFVQDIIDKNAELRKFVANATQPPPTVVERHFNHAFFNKVKSQITEISDQLELNVKKHKKQKRKQEVKTPEDLWKQLNDEEEQAAEEMRNSLKRQSEEQVSKLKLLAASV